MAKEILARGIDVSYANGSIDWTRMKRNIDSAIIRCGYGGDYQSQDDARWAQNVKGCEDNMIPYGVYLYSYATTPEKARSEAAHTIRLIGDRRPQYPVFLDLEEDRIRQLGRSKILEIAKVYCEEIEKAGLSYGTYSNKNWFTNYLTDSWYDRHPKRLAQYNNVVTYDGTYDIWQYSSRGTFEGFSGYFDLNYAYTRFANYTVSDARAALRASIGLEELSPGEEKRLDINGDGKITAVDARLILREATGLD